MTESEKQVPAVSGLFTPAPYEGNDLLPTTAFEQGVNELVDVDPSEVPTPVIKLDNGSEYAQSNREARDKFFIELGDRILGEDFRCWVLWIKKGHVLLPNDKHPGHAGIEKNCFSMDTKTGTVFGDCRECGLASWNVAKERGWRKPACDTSLTFGLWMENVGHAVFSVRSGAAKYARDFAKSIAPRNPFAYPTVFRIGTETFQTGPNEKKTINIARMSWDTRVRPSAEMSEILMGAARYTYDQRLRLWDAILERASMTEDSGASNDAPEADEPF